MKRIVICMGSNTEAVQNLAFARKRLSMLGDVRFATEQWTEAIGCNINQSPFLNQVALLYSSLSSEEIEKELKAIEQLCGRTAEEKAQEIIRLDIDLLAVNDKVLRPKDWERDYVKEGCKYLNQMNWREEEDW